MGTFTSILQSLSILLYCGFMAIFMLPQLFFWIFYTIPQIIRFSVKRHIRFSALWPVLKRIASWLIIITVLYVIAFIIDFDTGMVLLTSPTAIFSWGLLAVTILFTIFLRPHTIQDEFYNNVYLKYIFDEKRQAYDDYIEFVKKFTLQQAREIQAKKLSYLQRKAVTNRIKFLTENPEQDTPAAQPSTQEG